MNFFQTVWSRLICGMCALSVMVLRCQSSPIPTSEAGRWENPCGGTPVSTSYLRNFPNFAIPPEPQVDIVNRILRNLREGHIFTRNVKDRIFNERIENEEYKRLLDQAGPLNGFPTFDFHSDSQILANMSKRNIENFEMLARAAVFVEQTRLDEVSCDEIFKEDIIITENKHYSVMCNMQKVIESDNGTIPKGISRDIMSEEDRNQTCKSSNRWDRDYIIYTDVKTLYELLIREYEIMLNHLS